MDNRWRTPGIADVTLQAYIDHHAARELENSSCHRQKIKQIIFTIIGFVILCFAVWWLIIEPVIESKKLEGIPRSERKCQK
ncbi:hypothetical protein HCN44_004502 [Aphidius gifuensis]|uniref:Odorant receptor n=1 Tax=Aphidius gifuensis TaxID=684658 RepID=A0A835CW31_APHGI|nr:hypothetical protein HCN44_004502 [Aphidius gifuensis]